MKRHLFMKEAKKEWEDKGTSYTLFFDFLSGTTQEMEQTLINFLRNFVHEHLPESQRPEYEFRDVAN